MRAGELTFLPLLSGALAIGHRPPLRALKTLKAAGLTHVTTVLSEAEGARTIGAAVEAKELIWIWISLGSTKNLPAQRKPEVTSGLQAMAGALEQGGRIYLHCSAGIHRTGMIAAALLYRLGYDDAGTIACLAAMREITARDVGEARLAWARSFAPN